jgi:leucyl aminopeptidase
MKISFVNNLINKTNVINVSSVSKNCDIYISSNLDILNVSLNIKTMLKYNLKFKNGVIFNLKSLNKKFVSAFIYRITQGVYSFNKYKTKDIDEIKTDYYVPQLSLKDKSEIISIVEGSEKTRNIINEPSNKFTPENFTKNAKKMFKSKKYISVKIFDDKRIVKLGLNLINAVGGKSQNKPRFLLIDYNPPKSKKTICLVGKGVTIDTGGYSLKPGVNMNNMHMDKEGASICVGLIDTLANIKYKNRTICICPLVENIISSSSLKPNDIIKAYNGQTIEVVNVDAEGRLILADALAYTCKNYKPDYIFDFATLTGWSEKINCHSSFTYFTTNEKLSKCISAYGNCYGEKSIRLPPWIEYMEYIKSNVADVKNSGYSCKNSDGLMASLFLMNFIPPSYRNKWVHFDIRLGSYNNSVNIADGFASYLTIIKNI